ncbi:hypothetical protein FLM48_05120 [Shewanella sp. Scap07]|uniref:FUSC family protein n=1 Tax=Shewanella sp. Scap07 TaxID=2589987 RepID=UPI0015BF8E27|nr:FUSC family protein [Shewanella sp. Scap07]QLE84525.1 hypothetical protein FLM48_05120 [Shewanella sp. Scap07]
MLSLSTKEAIKVALSFSLAIIIALALGWDKPYWAAVTVIVLVMNETFAHSIKTARDRVLGTLFGIGAALVLIINFAQEPLLFLTCFIGFAGLCTYLSFNYHYGYIFKIGFMVCAIVSCIGSFDGAATFNIAILRIQETLLGVCVFSMVYRFLWPVTSESRFFAALAAVVAQQRQLEQALYGAMAGDGEQALDSKTIAGFESLHKMSLILGLPLTDSLHLKANKQQWQMVIRVLYDNGLLLQRLAYQFNQTEPGLSFRQQTNFYSQTLLSSSRLMLVEDAMAQPQLSIDIVNHRHSKGVISWQELQEQFAQPLDRKSHAIDALMAMLCITSCYGFWLWTAFPGGVMFPMVVASLSVTMAAMPTTILGDVAKGLPLWTALILTQYVLLLPTLTEAWQLGLFYFINCFAIWMLCQSPRLMLQRMLAGNLLVLLTVSALSTTPSYDISIALNMLVDLSVALVAIVFFMRLFQPLRS